MTPRTAPAISPRAFAEKYERWAQEDRAERAAARPGAA
jgi:hypothetical protein